MFLSLFFFFFNFSIFCVRFQTASLLFYIFVLVNLCLVIYHITYPCSPGTYLREWEVPSLPGGNVCIDSHAYGLQQHHRLHQLYASGGPQPCLYKSLFTSKKKNKLLSKYKILATELLAVRGYRTASFNISGTYVKLFENESGIRGILKFKRKFLLL